MTRQGGSDAASTVSGDRVKGRHDGGRRLKAAPREDEDGGGGHALTYGSRLLRIHAALQRVQGLGSPPPRTDGIDGDRLWVLTFFRRKK
jgi:hypothetical protein